MTKTLTPNPPNNFFGFRQLFLQPYEQHIAERQGCTCDEAHAIAEPILVTEWRRSAIPAIAEGVLISSVISASAAVAFAWAAYDVVGGAAALSEPVLGKVAAGAFVGALAVLAGGVVREDIRQLKVDPAKASPADAECPEVFGPSYRHMSVFLNPHLG